jgi:uncharacterized protein YbjT (DUF2867 family)
MRILIAGATGKTGRIVARKVQAEGHEPVALVRESSNQSVLPEGCETRLGDMTDLPADVASGIDAVIFAAGSGSQTGDDATRAIDRDGAMDLVDKSALSGVRRFVMLSSKGAEAPDEAPEGMQNYLQAKRMADDHLRAASVAHVILRPVSLTDEPARGEIALGDSVNPDGKVSREDVADLLTRAAIIETVPFDIAEMSSGDVPLERAIRALRD